jgi:nickel/cobalt transporter (NicO) family protein
MALGVFIAVVHTLSAVILVSILYFILNITYSVYTQDPRKSVMLISYGLITCMGMFLFIKSVVSAFTKNKENTREIQIEKESGIKKLIIPAMIIRFVPCEGAVILLVFSISINNFILGLFLAAIMSIGMAFMISLTRLITILSKRGTLNFVRKNKSAVNILGNVIEIAGAVNILLFAYL